MLSTFSTLLKRVIVLSALSITSALGYMFFIDYRGDGPEDDPSVSDLEDTDNEDVEYENADAGDAAVTDVADAGVTDVADAPVVDVDELLELEKKLLDIRRQLHKYGYYD
jgi:hypothetical protein